MWNPGGQACFRIQNYSDYRKVILYKIPLDVSTPAPTCPEQHPSTHHMNISAARQTHIHTREEKWRPQRASCLVHIRSRFQRVWKNFWFSELMDFGIIVKGCRSVFMYLFMYCPSSRLEFKLQESEDFVQCSLSVATGIVSGKYWYSKSIWKRNECRC